MAETAKLRTFRHTGTGALRKSKSFIGFPYEEISDAEAKRANAAATETKADEGAKGPEDK